ncbi:hypothetical protein K8T06_15610 [bacterium]|nr:hypothetical protein [bacterium]
MRAPKTIAAIFLIFSMSYVSISTGAAWIVGAALISKLPSDEFELQEIPANTGTPYTAELFVLLDISNNCWFWLSWLDIPGNIPCNNLQDEVFNKNIRKG